jgi:molybdate transport system substrate-binding protein
VAFAALIQRLGIAGDLKAKSQLTATGEEVSQAVIRGDAEFGVLPLSEILPVRGVEVLGTFPADVQSYIVMVAGAGASATQAAPPEIDRVPHGAGGCDGHQGEGMSASRAAA